MSARILVLDIETSPNLAYVWGLFKQDVSLSQIHSTGQVISFAARWHGSKQIEFWSDHHNGHAEMLGRAWKLLDEADIVVHWNGTSFDIPHLNREFALAGMAPPSPFKQVDLCLIVRKQFRFVSNKLDHIAHQLGVGGKLGHAGFGLWLACLAGDDKAWSTMRRYNRRDVEITDKVYEQLKPWIPSHPHVGLYELDPETNRCGRCGSEDLGWRGFAVTSLSKFRRYQCKGCGGWGRAKIKETGVDARPVA